MIKAIKYSTAVAVKKGLDKLSIGTDGNWCKIEAKGVKPRGISFCGAHP